MVEQMFVPPRGLWAGSPGPTGARGRGWAEVVEDALLATRPERDAHSAAGEDKAQGKAGPLLLRHNRAHLLLDLHWISGRRELEPVGQAVDMGVDGKARD